MFGDENEEKAMYDYQEVVTKTHNALFLLYGYEKLGWETVEQHIYSSTQGAYPQQMNVVFRLKRNKKIVNKVELNRLQSNFESCMREIDKMEQTKSTVSVLASVLIGMLGVVGIVAAIMMFFRHWTVVGIIFLALGVGICLLPLKIYSEVLKRQTEKYIPLIQENYREIDVILEKGSKLIY